MTNFGVRIFILNLRRERGYFVNLCRAVCTVRRFVGGVAQWLGRRSSPDGLSPPVPDLLLIGDHIVSNLSAMGQSTKPTQPSIPRGSPNE